MCNLNFLIKTNNKKADPQNDVLNAYNSACFNSFVENSDNEGFYFDHKNIKTIAATPMPVSFVATIPPENIPQRKIVFHDFFVSRISSNAASILNMINTST